MGYPYDPNKNFDANMYRMKKRWKKPRDPETLKDRYLQIRLTQHELEKLEAFANKKGITQSQVIRDYIRRLPNPPKDNKQIA